MLGEKEFEPAHPALALLRHNSTPQTAGDILCCLLNERKTDLIQSLLFLPERHAADVLLSTIYIVHMSATMIERRLARALILG